MLRVFRYVAIALDAAIAVAVGTAAVLVWLLGSVFKHPTVAHLVAQLGLNSWDYAGITLFGFGMVALNLSIVIDLVRRFCCPYYIVLRTEQGRVSISTRAIEDALRRVVLAVDGVESARISVSAPSRASRPVEVRAHVIMTGGIVYHDVSRTVACAVESKFSDIVGTGVPLACHVYWEKIKAEPGSAAASQRPQPTLEVVRPQFPVDQEDQSA